MSDLPESTIAAMEHVVSELPEWIPLTQVDGWMLAHDMLQAAIAEGGVVTSEWANSSEHPNWEAGWQAGYARAKRAYQSVPVPPKGRLARLRAWMLS